MHGSVPDKPQPKSPVNDRSLAFGRIAQLPASRAEVKNRLAHFHRSPTPLTIMQWDAAYMSRGVAVPNENSPFHRTIECLGVIMSHPMLEVFTTNAEAIFSTHGRTPNEIYAKQANRWGIGGATQIQNPP
ncbi:MAG: hypothetical protein QOF19_1815 [Alphaproteobacteria bacterium]|nr:hypothetical protein [Alphaproteobacteria bacterium]